jgi:hypothetical protein
MYKYFLFSLHASSALLAFHIPYHQDYKDTHHVDSLNYKNQATHWVQHYGSGSSTEDVLYLLVMAYLSWQRSIMNLRLQEKIALISAIHNDAVHIFNQARLDPSQYSKTPYPKELGTLFQDYVQTLFEHQKAGLAYHHAVTYLLDGDALTQKAGIRVMKKNSRTAVSHALMSILSSLTSFIRSPDDHSVDSDLLPATTLQTGKKGKIKKAFAHITSMLAHAFATTDKAYNTIEYERAKKLAHEKARHDAIWKIIDEVRSSFYQAYYTALYEHCISRGIEAQHMCLMIDEDGLHKNECLTVLPDPQSLSHHFAVS